MSKQGNIRVKCVGGVDLLFTTGRWGGSMTPQTAKTWLKEATRISGGVWLDTERYFLTDLIKDSSIERPVPVLGNTDTATVIVDFNNQTVSWFREHDRVTILTWSFDTYVKLDFESLSKRLGDEHPYWAEFYE